MANSAFAQFLSDTSEKHLQHNRKLIGYLLHGYTDEKSFAVSVPDNASGVVLLQAIKRMKQVVEIDCKGIDAITHRHTFARVNASTDLVVLHRLPKDYNENDFAHLVKNGVAVESIIPYNMPSFHHPKIMCMGDYAISPVMQKINLTVTDDYDFVYQYFFASWREEEWNLFYREMAGCVREWL